MSASLERAVDRLKETFPTLPWSVRVSFNGQSRNFGQGPEQAAFEVHDEAVLQDLYRRRFSSVLDRYVVGEVDFTGDIYSIVGLKNHVRVGPEWMVGFWLQAKHVWTSVIPSSVRRKLIAVSSHYDISNEFILSYLDTRTKAYSCAMWQDPLNINLDEGESLEDAQHHKFKMAAEELEIQENDKFLDLGCGYGYMVNLAEKEFNCKDASGITLSQNQIDEGYSKSMKLQHYFDLPQNGQYDKIYTCGMVSHLDQAEIERYYAHVYGMLKSGGRLWMHGIVPPANNYGMTNYNSLSGTFSQKYVFPDHFQFPVHVHLKIMERLGFRIRQVYFRYGHYAKTLRHWYKRYVDNLPKTRHMINPTIERAWHLYLTYASVVDGNESVVKQILATKD
jgi:cyclopropane-fatty-acyl-phospholipid synthase